MSDDASTELPPVPKFTSGEKVCGNCKLWQPHSVDHRGWVGPCRLQPQRGLFPPSAPICDKYAPKGVAAVIPVVRSQPERRARDVSPVVVRRGVEVTPAPYASGPAALPAQVERPAAVARPVNVARPAAVARPRRDPNEVIDLEGLSMTREELMELFREASGDAEAPPLAGKWEGGVIQIIPGNPQLQAKEVPIDALFHKVVMVRDRLRTLEQKINGHTKLTDAEKVEMQSYITRIYGSLTTFNVLFREKDDQFVGAKGDE